jgi:hypothetical protein
MSENQRAVPRVPSARTHSTDPNDGPSQPYGWSDMPTSASSRHDHWWARLDTMLDMAMGPWYPLLTARNFRLHSCLVWTRESLSMARQRRWPNDRNYTRRSLSHVATSNAHRRLLAGVRCNPQQSLLKGSLATCKGVPQANSLRRPSAVCHAVGRGRMCQWFPNNFLRHETNLRDVQ